MGKEVKVVKLSQIKPRPLEKGGEDVFLITKWREHSDKATLGIATLDAGMDFPDVCYEENDEILYQLEGDATITWKDGKVEFHPGMAIYIPMGTKFRYECHNKNKHIVVWAPAYEHYE